MRFKIRLLGIATSLAVISALGTSPLAAQAAATVCKDGSPSSTSGRGACSGHGGVDAAKTAAAKSSAKASAKAAKAEAKADAKAAKAEAKVDAKAAKAESKVDAKSEAKRDAKADARAGAGAAVVCSDGSSSRGGRGACSGHGGVKVGAAAPAPSPKNDMARTKPPAGAAVAKASGSGGAEDNNPAGSVARCKDGLYSHATHHQGACSRHGGVATWTN